MLVPINWHPSRKQLRTFAWTGVVGFSAVGAWIHYRQTFMGLAISVGAAATIAPLLWATAAFCGVWALLWPRAVLPLYLALTAVTLPIGFVVSHLMMATMYYLVVTPLGAVKRARGWNPMARRFEREASSYWRRRARKRDPSYYFRQY